MIYKRFAKCGLRPLLCHTLGSRVTAPRYSPSCRSVHPFGKRAVYAPSCGSIDTSPPPPTHTHTNTHTLPLPLPSEVLQFLVMPLPVCAAIDPLGNRDAKILWATSCGLCPCQVAYRPPPAGEGLGMGVPSRFS